ncbi:MAG: hypothetical protein ACYSWX_17395 [Planctomycetota bacterium]
MPETASDAPEWAVEPLERTLRWALGLRRSDGALICPAHGLEHTGKSANVAILALELWRLTGRQQWLDAAVEQGRRLVARLEREGTSPCFTFRPGRHDPFNCSNSVIDGGACSDALASLVLDAGEHLDPTDARNFAHASVLHARTYLRYAAVDKGVPAQRAWALTGIARALEIESAHSDWLAGESMAPGDGVLREAGLEAVSQLAGVQHADGSYPYHPLEWGAGHPGAADASSFYQSRVTAFLLHAQPTLGMPEITPELERGLDFLAGLQGPDGIKVGAVEAKPWYWGSEEEVASHPFDVFALAEGGHRAGRADWLAAAERAHRAWGELLTDEGRPRSHRNGPGRRSSYQCSLFWASHACWAARGVGRFGVDALPTSDTSTRGMGAGQAIRWQPLPRQSAGWAGPCRRPAPRCRAPAAETLRRPRHRRVERPRRELASRAWVERRKCRAPFLVVAVARALARRSPRRGHLAAAADLRRGRPRLRVQRVLDRLRPRARSRVRWCGVLGRLAVVLARR